MLITCTVKGEALIGTVPALPSVTTKQTHYEIKFTKWGYNLYNLHLCNLYMYKL